MRKMLIATASALFATAALPAAAQNAADTNARTAPQAQQQQQRSRDANASERRICVSERFSGSRMTHRVCRTPREWEALSDGSEDR